MEEVVEGRPDRGLMLGLAVSPADLRIAEEFFELFKTPWERAVQGRKYRIVLSTDGGIGELDGDLFLVYGSREQAGDREAGIAVESVNGPVDMEWEQSTVPLYRRAALFDVDSGEGFLKARGKSLHRQYLVGTRVVRRIGYDLFDEVRYLLTQGQPPSQALRPTLELHIALLRHLLVDSKCSFVEIPPVPYGHDFMCCLTHDVDFFGIRRHKFDRTLAGFVARASMGTLADLARGRRSFAEAIRNWLALCSLPLIFLRLLPDFWRPFADYERVERGRPSTFFLVPFRGRPGLAPDDTVKASRAVPYGIREIQEDVKKAAERGVELAVHGIDAWRDADAGRAEMMELTSLTGRKTAGVRMHWLYFAADSPHLLEGAGFEYDSTWGYNEAVGYRAGTSQAFRPAGCETLMELPLSIMDSALFSSARMGLGHDEASRLCRTILINARRFGGTLVINWHGRSLAPERLWGRFYEQLLREVGKENRAWFTAAEGAVEWFRWRRSIRFHATTSPDGGHVETWAPAPCATLPGAVIRIHRPSPRGVEVKDVAFHGGAPVSVAVQKPSAPPGLAAPQACSPFNGLPGGLYGRPRRGK